MTPKKEPFGKTADCRAIDRYILSNSWGLSASAMNWGSTVGRFATRIAHGSFILEDKTYTLAVNDHANHLHGGIIEFDRVLWRAEGFEEQGRALERVAAAHDPKSGRCMDWTTMPAIQLYTGNFLGGVQDSGGKPYPRHGAFCLETQYYPDCVNHPEFPSCILRPGQAYHHVTRHHFSVRRPR